MVKINCRICMILCVVFFVTTVIGTITIVNPTVVDAASKILISKTKATVYEGKIYQLKIKGTSSKVTWKSSKTSVATVSSKGKVNAKKPGTATVTAKVKGTSYKCKITVPAPQISCKTKSLELKATCTLKLNKTGKNITWSTSDSSIASVSSNGVVTAKKVVLQQ